ncbi:host attachment protein [Novosphingobium decolorationis]|uniref:Host attachment protein n=1 Tax=Novosphingobium decolorationis TaxID=2698673 RepID=A0ABX8E437_9SPHN|nr:host attachment protein [Novosphingobium decolorationis]QVM82991.1 host attachment protein [Novosphingobium decolorationis]
MLLPHGTMFALVDGENFELYRNAGKEASPELTAVDVPDLAPTNYSAGMKDHDAGSRYPANPKDRTSRLDEAAHVAAVTHWLNKQAMENHMDKLVVIADPKSLGEMRRHYHKTLEATILEEVPKTLTGRSGPEIVAALRA